MTFCSCCQLHMHIIIYMACWKKGGSANLGYSQISWNLLSFGQQTGYHVLQFVRIWRPEFVKLAHDFCWTQTKEINQHQILLFLFRFQGSHMPWKSSNFKIKTQGLKFLKIAVGAGKSLKFFANFIQQSFSSVWGENWRTLCFECLMWHCIGLILPLWSPWKVIDVSLKGLKILEFLVEKSVRTLCFLSFW